MGASRRLVIALGVVALVLVSGALSAVPAAQKMMPEDKVEGTPVPVPIAISNVTFVRRSTPLDAMTLGPRNSSLR